MEDEEDEFGQLYTDVLPRLSSSFPDPPIVPLLTSATAKNPPVVDPPTKHEQSLLYNGQTLVSDHQNPLKLNFHDSKIESPVTNLDNKNIIELENELPMKLEDKETVESRVLMSHPLDGNSTGAMILSNCDGLFEDESVFEVKNGDVEDNLGFEMGIEQNEEEIETGVSNVIGDPNLSVERSFIEPADNMDIDIDNLHAEIIFSEFLSCISIENFSENGENKMDKRALDTADDCGIGVKKEGNSDNEDDLNIILIDDENSGWVTVNENLMGLDGELKDGEDLFLVANSNQGNNAVGKECLAEDLAVVVDGERNQTGKGAKGSEKLDDNVGLSKGYDDNLYNFEEARNVAVDMLGGAPLDPVDAPGWAHVSLSCVRPVATAMPGGASFGPGGASGNIPMKISPIVDHCWTDQKPTGIKFANLVHEIYPTALRGSAWSNNSPGRVLRTRMGFTLPSHMTIFDINIDNLEENRWRDPGVDLSDFFNFGLDELRWKEYCKQMEQIRLESSMQRKTFVYGIGQSKQNNGPDLSPELAPATSICYPLTENPLRRMDFRKTKLQGERMEAGHELSPMLTGQAIQVQIGGDERIPSADTKRPRLSHSDAIIEIVLRDPMNDDDAENKDNKADSAQMETKINDFPHRCNVLSARVHKFIVGDGIRPFPLDSSCNFYPGFQQYAGIFGAPHEERKLRRIKKLDGMERVEMDEAWKDYGPMKREKFDESGPLRRNDHQALRHRPYNLHSDDYEEEIWRQKGRKDRATLKQPHEDNQSKQGMNTNGQRIRRNTKEDSKMDHQIAIGPTKREHVDCGSCYYEKIGVETLVEQERDSSLTTNPTDYYYNRELKRCSIAFAKHHEQETVERCHSSSRKQRDDTLFVTDWRDLKRGRSKLERWMSHDEDSDEDSVDSLIVFCKG